MKASRQTLLSWPKQFIHEYWPQISLIFILLSAAGSIYIYESVDFSKIKEHIIAVLLELALGILFIEILLRFHESRKEKRLRRTQLQLIKSAMFRKEMRDLFVADFLALREPQITLRGIRYATIGDLKKWQGDLAKRKEEGQVLQCRDEKMPRVVAEYVKAGPVWEDFKQFALIHNFEDVFEDMIRIQHLISDVKACQESGSEGLSEREAHCYSTHKDRVLSVWGDGIAKFIDFAIELQESKGIDEKIGKPQGQSMFTQLMDEYVEAEQKAKEKEEAKMNVSIVITQVLL